MQKNIDLKGRIVHFYDVNTGLYEDEIISYLKRNMKVRFHEAFFNNTKYVFTGSPADAVSNSITVTGYRKKQPGDTTSVEIK